MSDYKQRLVDDILSLKLSSSAAVLVEGPKWCGKTTTCLQIAKSSIYMDEKSTQLLGYIHSGDKVYIEKSETETVTVTLRRSCGTRYVSRPTANQSSVDI